MITNEYLREVEQRARRFSGAWTGTSGTLAADCMRLLAFIREAKDQSVSENVNRNAEFNSNIPPWGPTGPRHVVQRTVYAAGVAGPVSHALGADVDEYGGDPPPVARVPDPANPKDLIGSTKLPLHLWPMVATAEGCVALHNGALKYGRANWRAIPVRASIYYAALLRHMAAWFDGEEVDEEGVRHIGSALACLAILADAKAAGTLLDDRNIAGGWRSTVDRLTPQVSDVTRRHGFGPQPKHYTIADTPGERA